MCVCARARACVCERERERARYLLVLLVVPQAGVAHVEVAQDVSIAAAKKLGRLQPAAHRQPLFVHQTLVRLA